jgi:addiction module RelB/DinJ family antitoxin
MKKNVIINIRIDKETKEKAVAMLEHQGATLSEAITLFLKKVAHGQVLIKKDLEYSLTNL